MGCAQVTRVLWLVLICILHSVNSSQAKQNDCRQGEFGCGDGMCIERNKVCDGSRDCTNGQDEKGCSMQGIFQNLGNRKTVRFPVYKTVKGFDIYLRFTAAKCTGQLLEITSVDSKQFLRITLLAVGPIRISFNTLRGKGQLDVAMPAKGSFCDGKRHTFTLNLYRGAVFYNVDRYPHIRFYVSRLGVPFSSPDKIVLGRGLQGCISGSTVINRFNRTHEHIVGMSGGCSVKKTTVRPTTIRPTTVQPTTSQPATVQPTEPPALTYSARKIPTSKPSAGQKCVPLTLAACKGLGHNLTQVPNALKHKTTHQALGEFSAILSKLKTNCSPHLIPFLCQLYFPPCVLPQAAAPPCRSLCESVKEDCALVSPMDRWPDHLSCERFPRANNKSKCFLGSTKVTSRRTTMIRGSSGKEEDLTETNSMKKANGYPTQPVEVETTSTPITPTTKSKGLSPKRQGRDPTTTVPVYTGMDKYQRNETRIRSRTSTTPTPRSNTSFPHTNFTTPSQSWSENKPGRCGGVLTAAKGQLTSPGYPLGYPSNTTCRWLIALPNDCHVISFTFHQVFLEEDRNCVYDYIAVYDMLDNQVGQRYCGSITSPFHKNVNGNVAVVVFRSDSANSKKGFFLSYGARKCPTTADVEN